MLKINREKGVTLIALVVTIIVLLILAAVSLAMLTGENGILTNTKEAKEKSNKETATEIINLKITDSQIKTYGKEQRMPTLQEIADHLCEDDEIQYVTTSREVASIDKITVGEAKSIFTKLKEYPYRFEINSSLQLASVDGIKVAENIQIDKEEYDNMKQEIETLKNSLEYKPGDKISYIMEVGAQGLLTTGGKELKFTIFLGKNISKDVKSIEFSSLTFNVRHCSGGYLFGTQYSSERKLEDYFQVCNFAQNAITFYYNSETKLSGTNNSPVSVEISDLTLEFK